MIHARKDYNDKVQCIDGSIPEHEPVFCVRGQDNLIGRVIRFYLSEYLEEDNPDPQVIATLEAFLPVVDAWPKKKTADMPI